MQFRPGAHGHVKDGACLFCSRDVFRLSLSVLPGRPRESRRDELDEASPLVNFQVGKSRPGTRKERFEPKSLKAFSVAKLELFLLLQEKDEQAPQLLS